jgi:hypothetical protein
VFQSVGDAKLVAMSVAATQRPPWTSSTFHGTSVRVVSMAEQHASNLHFCVDSAESPEEHSNERL